MVITKLDKPKECVHCGGTIIADWYDGDWVCAQCGCVMYCTPPPEGLAVPSVDKPSGKGDKRVRR